jgi:hypothetical protein
MGSTRLLDSTRLFVIECLNRRHDTQLNDIRYNDIQHSNTQNNDTWLNKKT